MLKIIKRTEQDRKQEAQLRQLQAITSELQENISELEQKATATATTIESLQRSVGKDTGKETDKG